MFHPDSSEPVVIDRTEIDRKDARAVEIQRTDAFIIGSPPDKVRTLAPCWDLRFFPPLLQKDSQEAETPKPVQQTESVFNLEELTPCDTAFSPHGSLKPIPTIHRQFK